MSSGSLQGAIGLVVGRSCGGTVVTWGPQIIQGVVLMGISSVLQVCGDEETGWGRTVTSATGTRTSTTAQSTCARCNQQVIPEAVKPPCTHLLCTSNALEPPPPYHTRLMHA
jgi:hypothetical protein